MSLGDIPVWLDALINPPKDHTRVRDEIEVKFLLRKASAADFMAAGDVRIESIEQVYLDYAWIIDLLSADLTPDEPHSYTEWRIRQLNDKYKLTAKKPSGMDAAQRGEFEKDITYSLYQQLLAVAKEQGPLRQVRKTRYSRVLTFSQQQVLAQLDDYHQVAGDPVNGDFVTCEIEVGDLRLVNILRSGHFFAPALQFLHSGVEVTGIQAFSNRRLAGQGFAVASYDGLLQAIQQDYVQRIADLAQQPHDFDLSSARQCLARIESIQKPADHAAHDINRVQAVQDVLCDLAFGVDDSLGRQQTPAAHIAELDALGKGWLHDYHTIISHDAYLRLNSKPQVFRVGAGHTNTTTRGAHTQDVTTAAMQMARQLGLNMELCAAIAALHDIGHPAGGHVGEHILEQLSGRKFKHHVFSLSLADLFGLNLLREVQIGAFYHKSGGKKLMAPPGRPQEYGVVRIADKICYTPWDLFDSLKNGYLKEQQVPDWLFDTLGEAPLEWIRTMISAMVRESAEAHAVQFSEASGRVYEAFKTARKLVFEQVHTRIHWELLEADMRLCYDCIQHSFADLDPVPIVAYMTDHEVARVARMAESLPKESALGYQQFSQEGMGFVDIIDRLREPENQARLYYVSAKAAI